MGSPRDYTSAYAVVDSDAAAPVYFSQRGFTGAITRNGAGDYTLTLDKAYDSNTTKVTVSPRNAGLAIAAYDWASATTLRIRCATATVVPAITAADLDFTVTVVEGGPA